MLNAAHGGDLGIRARCFEEFVKHLITCEEDPTVEAEVGSLLLQEIAHDIHIIATVLTTEN